MKQHHTSCHQNNTWTGDLHSSWYSVHPTNYDPPIHNRGMHVNKMFSTNHVGKLGACPHEKIGASRLVYARCPPSKRGKSLGPLLILVMHALRFTYKLRTTRKWTNTIIHVSGNILAILESLLVLTWGPHSHRMGRCLSRGGSDCSSHGKI